MRTLPFRPLPPHSMIDIGFRLPQRPRTDVDHRRAHAGARPPSAGQGGENVRGVPAGQPYLTNWGSMPLDDSATPVADEPATPAVDDPAADDAATPATEDHPPDEQTEADHTEPEATTAQPVPEKVGAGKQHIVVLATVAAFVLAADEITKSIVVAHLDPGSSPRILGGLFYFSLIRNSGAAWGIAGGATILFALISAIVAGAIIRIAGRLRSTPWAIALGLLLGGALGNLSDRIFRAPGFLRGRVVDFISVFAPDGRHFPIFNLADSAITSGAIVLAIITLLGIGLDGSRKSIER